MHHFNQEIRSFCVTTGYRATPYLMTFLLSDGYFLMVFFIFATLLFCNAPFIDNLTPYDMIRAGRRRWFAGKLIYIALAALLFVALLFLMTLIITFPYIVWSSDWGKVFRTLALTSAGERLPQIDASLVQLFKPVPLTLFTTASFYLQCIILALIMFFTGILSKSRGLGIVIASFYSFLPGIQMFWSLKIFNIIFPPLWVDQSHLLPATLSARLTQPQALLVLAGIIVLLGVGSWLALKSQDVELYPEI